MKLKSELTDEHEIIIEKKSAETRLSEIRNKDHYKAMKQITKDYYLDEINDLKEYIDNIKTYKSPEKVD